MVIGGGAREHALVWKIAQNRKVGKIFIVPGNAGTAALAENLAIPTDDIDSLAAFALGPELTVKVTLTPSFSNRSIRMESNTISPALSPR